MKKIIYFILSVVLTLSFVAVTGCSDDANTIVVGAKDYTEQDVLGNIVTLLLENKTDKKIVYKHEMSSNVLFEALKSGDVDVSVDYTGTIYGSYLNYSDMKSAQEVYDISAGEMQDKFNLLLLDPLGFNNTYCLAVTPNLADEFNLNTYSDLAQVSNNLVFGGSFEILNRNDGIPKLKIAYDMQFKEELAIEGVLRYSAIERGDTQVTEAFSTDGMLKEYELVVLQDDKNFFPPYHAVPMVRQAALDKHPELLDALTFLKDLIDDDTMRELNYKVDVSKQKPNEVAKTFLQSQGII